MVLPDHKIIDWASEGGIRPFCVDNVNPASIDLRLGRYWRDFDYQSNLIESDTFTLYPKTTMVDFWNMLADSWIGRVLRLERKPTMVLAITEEWINVYNGLAAMIKLKTTPAREGLAHPLADWVDPGYSGKLTLMLTAHKRMTLEAGRPIIQLVIEEMEQCNIPYHVRGHYNNTSVPTGSWRANGNKNIPTEK